MGVEEADHGVFGGARLCGRGDDAAVGGGGERGDFVSVAVELFVFGPECVAAEVVLERRVEEVVEDAGGCCGGLCANGGGEGGVIGVGGVVVEEGVGGGGFVGEAEGGDVGGVGH